MATFALVAVAPSGGSPPDVGRLARESGLHPELVRRFVALGLVDAAPDAADRLAVAGRLRRDLGLNYAGAILACELLERIARLESRVRRYEL
jgi:chaperone modulatory protein CbpM